MDRAQLRNMIASGRAVALDCYEVGNEIQPDDPIGLLFKTRIMNHSVILKRFEPALATARQPVVVTTVVYFPYDIHNRYDGGESLDFNAYSFHSDLSFKITKDEITTEIQEQIHEDMEVLKLINSMHSLDPFMFKSKAEQMEVADTIHDAYFAISPKEWEKIRTPIRDKIQTLVTKALGESTGLDDKLAREQYIEKFLLKIWEAKDIEGIEPFVQAMQLQPEQAPDVFFAWKAVCYYQVRFAELLKPLQTMFKWVGHGQLCFPADHPSLTNEEYENIQRKRDLLRQKMRDGYISTQKVLNAYEHSYVEFVNNDRPQAFISFLEKSENSYLLLAKHVSIATHSLNLWKWYVKQYNAEMVRKPFMELFEGLNTLYGVNHTPEHVSAQGNRYAS